MDNNIRPGCLAQSLVHPGPKSPPSGSPVDPFPQGLENAAMAEMQH